jgi:hypothetical protein
MTRKRRLEKKLSSIAPAIFATRLCKSIWPIRGLTEVTRDLRRCLEVSAHAHRRKAQALFVQSPALSVSMVAQACRMCCNLWKLRAPYWHCNCTVRSRVYARNPRVLAKKVELLCRV